MRVGTRKRKLIYHRIELPMGFSYLSQTNVRESVTDHEAGRKPCLSLFQKVYKKIKCNDRISS